MEVARSNVMARIGFTALALALLVSSAAGADPITVDMVVARVDGRPILLSALRPRLLLAERQLRAPTHPGQSRMDQLSWRAKPSGRAAAERASGRPRLEPRSARRSLLESAIDEALLSARARQLSIRVQDADVDSALVSIARQDGLDVPSVLAQAASVGWSPRAYRAEIERQLLEQRVLVAELNRKRSRWPGDPETTAAWLATERAALLRRLRRHACIERRVRW